MLSQAVNSTFTLPAKETRRKALADAQENYEETSFIADGLTSLTTSSAVHTKTIREKVAEDALQRIVAREAAHGKKAEPKATSAT